MKITAKKSNERLEFFQSLYERAKIAASELDEGMARNMRQYQGSDVIDGSAERATTVRNITYEIIESQISSEIPQPKVDPTFYSAERARCAQSIELLCRSLRDKLPFEELNDLDERYTYIYGGSVWYVEWDSEAREGSAEGSVKVHCICPRDFIPEPNVYSVRDMDYCFLRFSTTRNEISRRYGIRENDLALAESEYECGDFEGDTVSVIVCFYKGDGGEIGRFVFSGGLILSDIEDYYSRKISYCSECGEIFGSCSCAASKPRRENESTECFIDQSGSGEPIRVKYFKPRSFPIVIRRNTSVEKRLFGQSDCEYIRPEQQAINKIESRILQKLLRAGITPIVPEDASITLNNSVFGQLIKMKPGESASQYGTVDTTPDISQDIAEAERLYEHSKRILGISDAYQGIANDRNESGYARQLQISQASGRLESKKKMKHTAYAELDKIIFELYLAFADEPRCLTYKDAFGRVHENAFVRRDFLVYDTVLGEFIYDSDYLFSVDLDGGSEYQREALWQRNLENLTSGTLGDPTSPATLLRYWQCQERAHYPNARENVEYFSEMLREA